LCRGSQTSSVVVQARYPVPAWYPRHLLSRGGGIEVLIPHGVILHGHMVCRPNSACRAIGKKVRPEKTDLARVFIFWFSCPRLYLTIQITPSISTLPMWGKKGRTKREVTNKQSQYIGVTNQLGQNPYSADKSTHRSYTSLITRIT